MRLEYYISEAVNGKKKHKDYEIPSAKDIYTSEDLIQFLENIGYSEEPPFLTCDAFKTPSTPHGVFKKDSYCVWIGRNRCVKVFRRSQRAVYNIWFTSDGKLADWAAKEKPDSEPEYIRSSEAIDEISVF